MSKTTPKLPARITSTFAIVEIKLGRGDIRKLVEGSYAIPFTIQGSIDPGKSGVGPSDNVGTEFSASIDTIILREPIFQPCDNVGRRYALAKNMVPGVILESDGGFTCMREGSRHVVKRRAGRLKHCSKEYAKDPFARLYVACKCGGHTLDGQLGENGELVGFYQVRAD